MASPPLNGSLVTRIGRLAAGTMFAAALLLGPSPRLAFADDPDANEGGLIRDTEIENTLKVYEMPVWTAAGLNPSDMHIFIVQDHTLNAFAAGGENIFLNTGLLLAARTPNEIIAVMAHETGHIAGGHLARNYQAEQEAMRPALISLGLGILAMAAGAPDAGGALIAGAGQFGQSEFVRHTQVQESSADQAAVTYLDSSGQSGRGLIDFFNHNLRQYEFQMRHAPPYLIDHPFTSDRVEALRQRIEAAEHRDAQDTPDNIERFKFMQAKLIGFLWSEGQTLARYPLSDTSQPARYARAVAYYRVSDLAKARAELNSMISASPNNPYFQELMGQILFDNGRAAESVQYHRRSVELAPNSPLLMINLARAIAGAANPHSPTHAGTEEAVQLLQDALRIEPDNAFGWRELAEIRDQRGEHGLADLASAEENYSLGDYAAALNFAERARRALQQGTPSFVRASDIVDLSTEQVRQQAAHRGQTGGGGRGAN